ncbi:hypothetical protein [Rhizobium oryzicola]|uniref:KTSC domain-containing protein n=1 Tax=Rhizobium oryzicola TaxID=1232668 RepID=A0ABT8STQ5_9HYPH|nr:hypothetical protein [Rhizobium oryzicola]MDO1581802.1 hypothetical protein [Rhizobium oryzicola]
MRPILLSVSLSLLLVTQAHAISRYQSKSMTCDQVHSAIEREGAVILRYSGRSGVPLYDRYVSSRRFCSPGEFAKSGTVPTSDQASCPVRSCEDIPPPDDCDSFVAEGCTGMDGP